jgi:hypothetical protein
MFNGVSLANIRGTVLAAGRRADPTAKAEEYYRRAIAVDDLWAPPKVDLATLLARQGKNDEAETLLREARRYKHLWHPDYCSKKRTPSASLQVSG